MSNELNLVSEDTFTEQTDEIVSAINAIGGGGVSPFIVTMSFNGANFVADKTFGEIKAAADDFKSIIIKGEIEGQFSQILFVSSIAQMGNSFILQITSLDNTVKSLTGAQNDYPTINLEE